MTDDYSWRKLTIVREVDVAYGQRYLIFYKENPDSKGIGIIRAKRETKNELIICINGIPHGDREWINFGPLEVLALEGGLKDKK